jgi:hypothetical protein
MNETYSEPYKVFADSRQIEAEKDRDQCSGIKQSSSNVLAIWISKHRRHQIIQPQGRRIVEVPRSSRYDAFSKQTYIHLEQEYIFKDSSNRITSHKSLEKLQFE